MSLRRVTLAAGIAIVAAAWGCAPAGPKILLVTGRVTLDGEPVEDGEIILNPVDDGGAPEAGVIVVGNFQLKSRVGQKRVSIQNADGTIPQRYNEVSEIEIDITAAGPNEFEFELVGNPAAR